MHKTLVSLTLTLFLFMTAVACQVRTPIGPVRATSMAPDLKYLPPEEIRTSMWVLAAETQHLETLLADPTAYEGPALRTLVRGALERMRIAATTLDQPGRTTQHPVINQNLENFVGRLERARRAVDRDPPSYFLASSIAGSCFVCHGEGVASAVGPTPFRDVKNPAAWPGATQWSNVRP